MVTSQTNLIFSFLLMFNSLVFLLPLPSSAVYFCYTNAIYQLGDSLSDTGNFILESKSPSASICGHLPYGISFFGHPTGRWSDGLLMIDYIALFLRLPLLNPYLAKNSDFTSGVSFAVAGATALDPSFFAKKNITVLTNSTLSVQLNWLKSHLKSTCNPEKENCEKKLRRSIFFVGEIGGDDYNDALIKGKTTDEIQKIFVPSVIQSIKTAVKEIIKLGATRLVIPGNLPIGCLPIFLTLFQSNNTADYDELHCLKGLNNFSTFHNDQLQEALQQLRDEYPDVDIIYGNYYDAYRWILKRAPFLGFDIDSRLKACCGSRKGKYNFDLSLFCGAPKSTTCQIPDSYMSWDGIHLTQKANWFMAHWLIREIIPQLKCLF